MNKRIEELTNEALGIYLKYPWSTMDDNDIDVFSKRFAELIIRECLNQCYNRGMNDELYAGQLKAAAYIEEYFGVEE